MTDVRIISYLFICHCESYFREAKNSFLTNCTCSMFPLSLILFNSNNEQQSVEVQQRMGESWECMQVILLIITRRRRRRKCQYIVPYIEAIVFLVHIHYLLPLLLVCIQDCFLFKTTPALHMAQQMLAVLAVPLAKQLSHQDVSLQ